MRLLQKAILVAGLLTLGFLLWKLDTAEVWRLSRAVGWGFLLILAQEAVPHLFNALGWVYAMSREDVRLFRFKDLYLHRIQGDGVNYLTPSGTIAGEYTRALLLDNAVAADIRMGGVAAAKCTQSLAQIGFVMLGAAFLLPGRISALSPYEGPLKVLAVFVLAGLPLAGSAELLFGRKASEAARPQGHWLRAVPSQVRGYFHAHPWRLLASTLFFGLGYAWSAFEVYWACSFLGAPVGVRTAFVIEVLSNSTDMVFFMVPAKAGTQEAGKTVIFHWLGLGARTGLAFGIVRHLRELLWAALGMALYSLELRKNPGASLKGT